MRRLSFRSKVLLGGLVLLGAAAAVAWYERVPLLTWFCVRALGRAGEADRDVWADRVVGLGDAAVPELIGCLARDDPRLCESARVALARFVSRWGAEDPRRPELAARLVEAFPRLSSAGRQNVVALHAEWLSAEEGAPPPAVVGAAGRVLALAARTPEKEVRAAGLRLAAAVLAQPGSAEALGDCRELVQVCLKDPEPANRVLAARVAAQHAGLGLLEQVMPLLNDPAAEVRREAMLAARAAPETIVKTDNLLRWLHDPDEDVRHLCEAVLHGRGMTEVHLKLARLLTDERPSVRLQVLDYLHPDSDLEPGVWLRLLSIDPEPAVRVAAIRAAVFHPVVDLSDRIAQMSQSDPSPTVCQLARLYLSWQHQRKAAQPRP
jgi:HEAT repeats